MTKTTKPALRTRAPNGSGDDAMFERVVNAVRMARPDHWFKNIFLLPGVVLAASYQGAFGLTEVWKTLVGLEQGLLHQVLGVEPLPHQGVQAGAGEELEVAAEGFQGRVRGHELPGRRSAGNRAREFRWGRR